MHVAWRKCQRKPSQTKWGLLLSLRSLEPCLPWAAYPCWGRGSFVWVAWWFKGQDHGLQRSRGALVPAMAQDDATSLWQLIVWPPFDILVQVCWGQPDQPRMIVQAPASAEAVPLPIPRGSGAGRQNWESPFPPPGSDGDSIILATCSLEHIDNSVCRHLGNYWGIKSW